MLKSPLSHWPQFEQDEQDAVSDVLQSRKVNYWAGSEGNSFESEFATYCGVNYAVAVANGTLALEVALHACGVAPGDDVIVPCRTFLASASAVVARGATPIIADVDLDSQNITADTIAPWISKKTKAIIAVHLAGWPCDMGSIMALANETGLYVIEDCAQAHGATYKGKSVGSLGHIAAFSFCQDKIMTTGGEGGMVVTNDKDLWEKSWEFKDHGKSYDTVFNKEHPPGFRWLHESWGSNYRLTEMQSAIGRTQLKKLDSWVDKRRQNADALKSFLSGFPFIKIAEPNAEIRHSYYKFYCFFDAEKVDGKLELSSFIKLVNEVGIPCMNGSCFNISFEKCFELFPSEYRKDLANAAELQKTSLMFICDHTVDYKRKDIQAAFDQLQELVSTKLGQPLKELA